MEENNTRVLKPIDRLGDTVPLKENRVKGLLCSNFRNRDIMYQKGFSSSKVRLSVNLTSTSIILFVSLFIA